MKPILEIHKNVINANSIKRIYEIWLRNRKTNESKVAAVFSSVDEALYYATYDLDYMTDEIKI